jgi:hypothetical protein
VVAAEQADPFGAIIVALADRPMDAPLAHETRDR